MKTTFDKFITDNSEQKALFDKEYAEFSRSETALQNLVQKKHTNVFTTSVFSSRKVYAGV
jgi:hypothetical protein